MGSANDREQDRHQGRACACAHKPLTLAPGVLDDGTNDLDVYVKSQRRREAQRLLTWVGFVQVVLVLLFMAAGYLAGRLQ